MLKVLQIDTNRLWRGGQQQVFLLIKMLIKRKIYVSLATQPKSELGFRCEKLKKCMVHYIKMRNEFDIVAIYNLFKIIKKEDINIIHSNDSRSQTLGSIAAKLAGVNSTFMTRRVSSSINQHFFNKLKYSLVRNYIGISNYIKREIEKIGIDSNRVHTIHSGILINNFEKSINKNTIGKALNFDKKAFIIGSIGSLTAEKGHLFLISAFKRLAERYNNLFLLIVGEGDQYKEIEKNITGLQLKNRVRLLNFRSDIPDILSAIDILILASRKEGLGTILIEALAAGVPVVATEVGGVPEVINSGKNGYLVKYGDEDSLVNSIIKLIKNQKLRNRFIKYGRYIVKKKFDINKNSQKIIDLYNSDV